MEDLFKILFYTVAVVIWIIYKFRQQKKSGMWKPRINLPVPEIKTESNQVRPVAKPVVPKSGPSYKKPVRSREKEGKTVALENQEVTEAYNTTFLKEMMAAETSPGDLEATSEPTSQSIWLPDIRKAILASEILKRPQW